MRQISIEGWTAIFKSNTVFKVIHLLLLRTSSLLQLLHNYEKYKNILSGRKKNMKQIATTLKTEIQKCKHSYWIVSIRGPWVKRLFDDDLHHLKIIPQFLISKYLSKILKFHCNLHISKKLLPIIWNILLLFSLNLLPNIKTFL